MEFTQVYLAIHFFVCPADCTLVLESPSSNQDLLVQAAAGK